MAKKGKHAIDKKASSGAPTKRSSLDNSASKAEDPTTRVNPDEHIEADSGKAGGEVENVESSLNASNEDVVVPDIEPDEEGASAVKPAFKYESSKEIETDKKKGKKKTAIFFLVLVLIVGGIYLGGVAVFSQFYAPNTKISGIDVSFKQPTDLASMLSDDFSTYKVNVKGEGLNFDVDASSAEINVNTEEIANYAISSFDVWKWPVSFFEERDLTSAVADNLNVGKLADVVDEKVKTANENKAKTENAHIEWNKTTEKFAVVPEVNGNELDTEKVKEAIVQRIVGLKDSVTITSEACKKPTIFKDDERFNNALAEANKLGKASFDIMMNDNKVATVDGNTAKDWVSFEDEFTPKLNDEAVTNWANSIADGCNTVGTERSYLRPNGNKSVTVSGGTYGWEADSSDLAARLIENINSGSTEAVTISATQTANALVAKGQPDWGGRWIDVDLNEQHAYMYIDNQLVWETDVITGNPTIDESTPVGVWKINNKQSPSVLVGSPDANGNPSYRNPVQYWIPFVDNMIGLHDASWRSTFGGNINTISSWSHGCVNLPIAKATEIWDLCVIGDAVIVHY